MHWDQAVDVHTLCQSINKPPYEKWDWPWTLRDNGTAFQLHVIDDGYGLQVDMEVYNPEICFKYEN